eukprot:352319_1
MSNFRKNENYVVIKQKKPSKLELIANPDVNYYAGFRLDKYNGPFLFNNKWCIDTKYYSNLNTIYAIPIGDILNDNIKQIHNTVIENLNNEGWNVQFVQWFSRNAPSQPLLHSIDDIIFSTDKYILISRIANSQQRLTWNSGSNNYYTKNAKLYGGKEIDVYQSISEQKIIFEDDEMCYASNYSELVSNNFCSPKSRLLSLAHHDKKICMIKTLYMHLRKIRVYSLKHHKFGKEKELKIPIIYQLFVPYMVEILKRKHIYYEQTKKDLFFSINDKIGDAIFHENLFSKMYGNDKVFAYSIQFIHNRKSNNLEVKFYVLQQDQRTPDAPLLGYEIVNKAQ